MKLGNDAGMSMYQCQ